MSKILIDDGLGPIKLLELGPASWQLLEPFVYVTSTAHVITVPAGFVTDGASSPFHILIRRWNGHYSTAVLLHDWLYKCLRLGTPDPAAPIRKEADAILFEGMAKCGVNFWVEWGVWFLVRGAGNASLQLGVKQ